MAKAAVKLFAQIGDQHIDIGECRPAQARILVKKEHATWKDGKLLLFIRPIHLMTALSHQLLEGEDRSQVSKAELDRRIAWLRGIMQAVVASDTHGSDIDHITGHYAGQGMRQTEPRDVLDHVHGITNALKRSHQRVLDTLGPGKLTFANLKEGIPLDQQIPKVTLTAEEIEEWFDDSKNLPTMKFIDNDELGTIVSVCTWEPLYGEVLERLWATSPDVSKHFHTEDPYRGVMAPSWLPGPRILEADESRSYTPEEWENGDVLRIEVDFALSTHKAGVTINRVQQLREEAGLPPLDQTDATPDPEPTEDSGLYPRAFIVGEGDAEQERAHQEALQRAISSLVDRDPEATEADALEGLWDKDGD